jgi:hypothetical protein
MATAEVRRDMEQAPPSIVDTLANHPKREEQTLICPPGTLFVMTNRDVAFVDDGIDSERLGYLFAGDIVMYLGPNVHYDESVFLTKFGVGHVGNSFMKELT